MNWWKLKNRLFRLFHPSFWIQLRPTCWEWDAELQCELFLHGAVRLDRFTAQVGKYTVWATNYPYSFGHTYPSGPHRWVLPAPLTRVRLRNMIKEKP